MMVLLHTIAQLLLVVTIYYQDFDLGRSDNPPNIKTNRKRCSPIIFTTSSSRIADEPQPIHMRLLPITSGIIGGSTRSARSAWMNIYISVLSLNS